MSRPASTYRVVFTAGERIFPLGTIRASSPAQQHFDPFVSRLLREGITDGELTLVDTSGRVVARREVRPPTTRQPIAQPSRTIAGRARQYLRTHETIDHEESPHEP